MINHRILILSIFALTSCGPGGAGSTGGNPNNPTNPAPVTQSSTVQVKFSSFDSSQLASIVTKDSLRAVTQLKMCFKRIRFKTSNTDTGTSVDLNVGEVTLNTTGTALTNVSVSRGTYSRIEFDIDDHCELNHSILLSNSSGTYTTRDHIQVRFEGTFEADQDTEVLELGLSKVIDQLNLVRSDDEIKDRAESVSGAF